MNRFNCLLLILLLFVVPIYSIEFYKSRETINVIKDAITKKCKGAYLRIGDGELLIAHEGQNDSHQNFIPKLQQELRAALSLNGPYVFKTIPLYHEYYGGLEEYMSPGNHAAPKEFCDLQLSKARNYWGAPIEKVYSHVALSYLACYHPEEAIDFLLFLKKTPCTVLAGNKNIPEEIRSLLFGDQCHFVGAPESQAYEEIDRIEQQCKEILDLTPGYKIVITSMGGAGKALQKRLYHQYEDIFLFDFGSTMDALFNAWEKSENTKQRAWIPISGFDREEFIRLFKKKELING